MKSAILLCCLKFNPVNSRERPHQCHAIAGRDRRGSSRSSDDRHALGRAISTVPAEAACLPRPMRRRFSRRKDIRPRYSHSISKFHRDMPARHAIKTVPASHRPCTITMTLDVQSHYLNSIASDWTVSLTHKRRSQSTAALFHLPFGGIQRRNRAAAPRIDNGIILERSRENFPLAG